MVKFSLGLIRTIKLEKLYNIYLTFNSGEFLTMGGNEVVPRLSANILSIGSLPILSCLHNLHQLNQFN